MRKDLQWIKHLDYAHGRPILTMTQSAEIEGAVLLPIVDPVPLYPSTVMHHRDLEHPGLRHLQDVIGQAIERWRWLESPTDSWVPQADAAVFGL